MGALQTPCRVLPRRHLDPEFNPRDSSAVRLQCRERRAMLFGVKPPRGQRVLDSVAEVDGLAGVDAGGPIAVIVAVMVLSMTKRA